MPLAGLVLCAGCGGDDPPPPPLVDVPVERPIPATEAVGADAVPGASFERAGGGPGRPRYLVAAVPSPGVIAGRLTGGKPLDTTITPAQDPEVCRPFTETLVSSVGGGIGGAVVWLEGIGTGPAPDAPPRVTIVLDRCRLEPRVQRVAVGGTVMVNGRDAMYSRLRFVSAGRRTPRATVLLSDVGQVVPVSEATTAPGLVRIQDDRHPWIRGWLAVIPHPFVAITTADGRFRFEAVPPGRYTLVAWHERLGERRLAVRIEGGVQTAIDLPF